MTGANDPRRDWLFCDTCNALVPHNKLMESIEALWTKVPPKFM